MYFYQKTVILVAGDLHVEKYEAEEVLINYTPINSGPFKEVVECIVNSDIVHLTKE